MNFTNIPISILLGILFGAASGYLLSWFFETAFAHKRCVRNSTKVVVILGMSFLLVTAENGLKRWLAVLAILITAPMGALGIDISSQKFLRQEGNGETAHKNSLGANSK